MNVFIYNKYGYQLLVIIQLFFLLLLGFPSEGIGKAYKYQDKQGQWHYTDKPPQKSLKSQEIQIKGTKKTALVVDLADRLKKKFPGNRPEEIATLAVVEVKSALGLGSGFFLSEYGYIVTNKHVVKPTETNQWKEYEKELAEQERIFRATEREFDQRSAYHDRIHDSLVEFEKTLKKRWDRSSKRILDAEYERRKNHYWESKRQLEILKSDYISTKRNFEKSKSLLSRKGRESYWAQRYKIKIKDGTELYAKYIAASKDHDLAFLKLDGYKTPFLVTARQNQNLQGSIAYAIGSPLGVFDSLTSGKVTRVQSTYIYTDISIFPGNSGGPLIDRTGKVLGVITQKVTQNDVMSKGFGLAIPIKVVNREFDKIRTKGRYW